MIAFFTFGGRSVGGTGMGTQRGGWHRGQTPEPTGVSSNGVSSNGGWHRDRKPLTICRLVIGIPRAVMDAHSGGRTWWVAPGAAQDRHCNQHADELVPGRWHRRRSHIVDGTRGCLHPVGGTGACTVGGTGACTVGGTGACIRWVAPGSAQDRHCNQHADRLVPGRWHRRTGPSRSVAGT